MLLKTVLVLGTMATLGASLWRPAADDLQLSSAEMSITVGSCTNGNGTVTGSYCDQSGANCLTEDVGGEPDCCLYPSGRDSCFTEQTPRSNGSRGDWIIVPIDCTGTFREFPCTCNNNGFCVSGAVGKPLVCQPTKTETKKC